jgi:3-isopropylmalate/(R)-2-methylmalate dehydratase small subunit
MEKFVKMTGRAAPFPASNVDTDVIMPKTFLKGVDRTGLDVGVFNLLRFKDGKPDPEFILNKPGYEDAKFLIVGPNFGCGSSREHAVWGLSQLGIRVLIGSSFAGIFDDNCRNNGILTITLVPDTIEHILNVVSQSATNEMTVDLADQTIALNQSGETVLFEIDPLRKRALLEGLDPIGQTLVYATEIRSFEAGYKSDCPWLFPNC